MPTEIEVLELDVTKVYVNGKEIIQDTNGNWVCREELTPSEQKAFRQHLNSIQKK
ncbi:hypothetical protein [Croceivirga sp. JEA036]|uniref:hypothetical protein n=1 Tax=Croceivirga sp. JEA036 TaxID=2721162 RepID=UPI001439F69B|nr:hypothetical protein [Croceivirga sp. JEA036]NJB36362.1 hypothetical protein [Croceivirga sp. JEA036]